MTALLQRLLFAVLALWCLAATAIEPNATNISIDIPLIDGDGNPLDPALMSGSGQWQDAVLKWRNGPRGAVNTLSMEIVSDPDDVHVDGGAVMPWPGVVRVDMPDSPWASGASVIYVTLDLSAIDASYVVAGNEVAVPVGYGLQQPDSGTGTLARADDVEDVGGAVSDVYNELGTIENHVTSLHNLSAQEVRDALKLAPTGGSAASGSIDTVLGTLATSSALTTVSGKIDTIDGIVDSILEDTAAIPSAATIRGEFDGDFDSITDAFVDLNSAVSLLPSASSTATAVWANGTRTITTTIPSASDIRTEIDTNSTKLASILEDTAAIVTPLDATATQEAAEAAIEAKLAEGATHIAGAGTDAKTLDDITVGDVELSPEQIGEIAEAVAGEVNAGAPAPLITQRVHAPNFVPFGRMSDGWYKAKRPVRVAVGSQPLVAADMREWGEMTWSAVQQPTTSDATVASPGDVAGSTYGISTTRGAPCFKLAPHASAGAGETCVITVQATADGQPVRLDFDVEVVAGGAE